MFVVPHRSPIQTKNTGIINKNKLIKVIEQIQKVIIFNALYETKDACNERLGIVVQCKMNCIILVSEIEKVLRTE